MSDSTKSPFQGRYFLINGDNSESGVGEGGGPDQRTTLILTLTIAAVSSLLSVLLAVQICRKFRRKAGGADSQAESASSCYECRQEQVRQYNFGGFLVDNRCSFLGLVFVTFNIKD